MLDPLLRRWIDPPLERAGGWLAARGVSPNSVTVTGLCVGLTAVPLIASGYFGAALLLASFVCTCASFLGRAVLAAGRGEADAGTRGRKSFFHAAGLVEGTETILGFILFCLLPDLFPWLASVMAALCFWTAFARLVEARGVNSDS